jgi:hypothetical protein
MEHPTIVLGVEMMDQDHLRIEKMFEAASHAPDEDLPVMLFVMPQLVLSHVTTMDRMAAAFLNGKLGQADFDVLRLPLPGLAE